MENQNLHLLALFASRCNRCLMNESDQEHSTPDDIRLTPQQAKELLDSAPARPRRQLKMSDHVNATTTIILSLASGALALSGYPWWAIIPALGALVASSFWVTNRRSRPNEPRFKISTISTIVFATWLTLPIWRGITRGDTAPFPEAWILAGLAPIAWLVFYLILIVRR